VGRFTNSFGSNGPKVSCRHTTVIRTVGLRRRRLVRPVIGLKTRLQRRKAMLIISGAKQTIGFAW
jgi:hypothetical protein